MTTVRVRFRKTDEAAYISLLDLQRVMGRALRRSGIPVYYTQGFNPHIYLTFAVPLGIMQESLCETVDFKTEAETVDEQAWTQALNGCLPKGITVQKMYKAETPADDIAFAQYTVYLEGAGAQEAVNAYNAAPTAPVIKKGKKGKQKEIDLKEYCPILAAENEDGCIVCRLTLPTGNAFTVSPMLYVQYLQQQNAALHASRVLRVAVLTKNQEVFW